LKFFTDDFFVGIGDINSTFLPKIEPLTASTPPPSTPSKDLISLNISDLTLGLVQRHPHPILRHL